MNFILSFPHFTTFACFVCSGVCLTYYFSSKGLKNIHFTLKMEPAVSLKCQHWIYWKNKYLYYFFILWSVDSAWSEECFGFIVIFYFYNCLHDIDRMAYSNNQIRNVFWREIFCSWYYWEVILEFLYSFLNNWKKKDVTKKNGNIYKILRRKRWCNFQKILSFVHYYYR